LGLSIRTIIIVSALILFCNAVSPATQTSDLATAEKFLERGRILYEELNYDSLPYYYLGAKTIFQRLNRQVQAAECFLKMSDYFRATNRFDKSAETLDSADKYIEEHLTKHSESWADALHTRAKLLTSNSQHDQAIELLGESLELLEKLDAAPEKLARTENTLGSSYYYKGDLQNSQEYWIKSFATYQLIVEGPSAEKGLLLYHIGLVHSRKGNHREWKEYISRSIANYLACFGPDYPDLAKSYSSLTSYFIDNGMSDSALYYLEKSEEIERRTFGEDYGGDVSIYIQRARIFRLDGNYDRAKEYYQKAYVNLQGNNNTLGFKGRTLYRNMGSLYKSLEEYDLAEEVLLNLLKFEGEVHPTDMATNYYYLGDIQRLLGNYSESEKYFRKIFTIHDQYMTPDHHRKIYDFLGYGILMDSLKMYHKADQYYIDAVRIAKHNYGFHDLRTAKVLQSTGDHFQLAGEQDTALAYYQQSIFSMVPEYDVAGYAYNPPAEQVHDNLFYLGLLKSKASVLKDLAGMAIDAEDRMQKIMAEYSSYQTSISIIDQLRNSYLSDRSKMYLSENERETYERCVESAYQCYELSGDPEYLNQAFMVAEKAKYATLLSVLQREQTIALAGIPDSIVQIDYSLRKELSFQQELLIDSQDDTPLDTTAIEHSQARIFQIKAQIESLNKRLERDYPAYYNLLYNQQVLGPDALRKKLRSSEKLLEYFYTSKYLYRFELSRQGFDCNRIPLGVEFDMELAVVERYLTRVIDDIDPDSFLTAAFSLHNRLIPPSPDHSRLIIIPEGKLSYLPFDILVSEPVENFSGMFNRVPFLIEDFTIRYGYSATLMDNLEKGDRIKLDKLIAFAPGYDKTSDLAGSAGDFREIPIDRESLMSLPHSINEVEEIGVMTGGRAFTHGKATEELFKKLVGESHLIHLALHAFLDDDDPLKSKLVFSEGNLEEDGFLNVYEIYNLDLTARMVVLSACNTGTGGLKRGEGIMSLTRAFIYAGVPNIIMTLWTVSDRQSKELMLGFYRQLIAGRSTETALQRAKLEFLEKATPHYQDPQFWAGYILVGSPDKFFLSRVYKLIIPVSIIILILVPGFILMQRRMSRRKG